MAARRPIQFGTQLAQHLCGPLINEFDENLYLEIAPEGSKFPYVLIGTPGLKLFATVGDGPVRGVHALGPHLFVVSAQTIYRVSDVGATTQIGHVGGTGTVEMADNGTHVWIATGGPLYAVNRDGIFEIANGHGFTSVTYQDGYLMGVKKGTQEFHLSKTDDALTVGGLDFTTADTLPGLNVGLISDHREPLVFKEDSVEAFYNSGAAAFPFQRSQVVERGCGAGASIAKAQNAVFWLGDDLLVYQMVGYDPRVISTPTVARLIQDEDSPQTASGFTHQSGGHTFYVLTLSGVSLAYDINTERWHRRRSDGLGRWRVGAHSWVRRWRKNIVGDYATGDLYELDPGTHDENGGVLRRRAAGAPVFNSGNRFIVNEFMLDAEAGLGLVTGQGSDPQAALDWTSDGGKTWSSELWRSLGAVGDRGRRANWHGLGAHYNWTPRITITDPVPVRVAGAYCRTTGLAT